MFRRVLTICFAALFLAGSADATERVLNGRFSAAGVAAVQLTNGVGDVAVTTDTTDAITVEVTLIPRRGGLFSSFRNAEKEVESARLSSRTDGSILVLGLESSSSEPRFEARWDIVVPAATALELELGVGDVTIRGVAGGVELELGVGDAAIEVTDGSVEVSVGVGDATVRAPASSYGDVEASGGVGGADVIVRDQRITGEGFVGQSSSWHGDGSHTLTLEVGVGDARVALD